MQTLIDLWLFFKERKKWILFPIVLVLLFFGVIVVVGGSSSLAPLLYTLF